VFSKEFDRRVYLLVTVLLASSTVGVAFGVYALWPGNREAGYEPEQPIAYSHRLHAGELKIDCRYCHGTVDVSAHAAVPTLAVCMNCHSQVQPVYESSGKLKREIAKLLDAWEFKRSVAWEKVHILADFVYFDHSRHVAAGLECEECHGRIETMERVRRVNALTMGWCLDCHRRRPAGAAAEGRVFQAPENCSTCHR
jgi:hypothetical protein